MNQVDFFIFAVVLAFGISGARRGLVSSGGDIAALLLGLAVASVAYPLAAAPIGWIFGLPPAIEGALGFTVMALLIVIGVSSGFSLLAARFGLPAVASRAGGAGFGAALGVLLAAVLVMASGALPGAAKPVDESALGMPIITLVPGLHEGMESVGLPLPKLVQLPTDYRDEVKGVNQGLQFLRMNASQLDGATCIHCRSGVDFRGYQFSRGTLMSPLFRCPECTRTSDGCQTFEGFHEIYGDCPVALADEGLLFDCGVWTNGWWAVPKGRCPVCGREHRAAREAASRDVGAKGRPPIRVAAIRRSAGGGRSIPGPRTSPRT